MTMQDHELRGLLGPAYDETTDEQRAQVSRVCETLDRRWPLPDFTDEHTDALNAALEVILGDSTPEGIVSEWRAARAAEQVAHRRLSGAVMVAALTVPETTLVERLGVSRPTIRKALGK